MADTTVEITDEGESESVAEVTQIEAVAETAKSEAIAEQAANDAQDAKYEVKADANAAEQSAVVSADAAFQAGTAALQAKEAAFITADTVSGLQSSVDSLNNTISQLLANQQPAQDIPPAQPIGEEPPKKSHWLTRSWGAKK